METIKNSKGVKYREKIYFQGREIKSPCFERKTDAKNWKMKKLIERDQGISLNRKSFEKITIDTYSIEFLIQVQDQKSKSTYLEYKSMFKNHISPLLGRVLLSDISKSHWDLLLRTLKNKNKNEKGINLVLGFLKRIINSAVADGYLPINVLSKCSLLRVPPKADVFLTELEIRQLLSANLRSDLYPLYAVAIYTGLRRGELAGLKWDRINFENKLIEVTRSRDREGLKETTKSHEKRIVPINARCREIFQKLLKDQKSLDYVFTSKNGEPFEVNHTYRKFKEAQVKAGFERYYRFHDLRHTFASHFMMKGGNIFDLQKILGHSSMDMTQRYAHLSPSHLANSTHFLDFEFQDRPDKGQDCEGGVNNLVILNS